MRPARRRTPGFTLIELMVVIAILGIIVAIAVVRQPAPTGSIEAEAMRLIASIDLLSQQAIVRGVPHALEVWRDRYRLCELRGGEWIEKYRPGIQSAHALPAGMRLKFDHGGMVDTERLRVVMLPSGESSAESFTMFDERSGESMRYAVDDYGHFAAAR